MSDLRDKLKEAKKEAAAKILKITAPFMLFGVNQASAAEMPTQDKEEFSQEILVQTDNDTSFSRLTYNNSEETELFRMSTNLSNGYRIEEYQCDTFDKASDTTSTQYGKTLLRPDNTSIDVTEMLEQANDIIPVSGNTTSDRLQKAQNTKTIINVLKKCNDLSESDQEAIHEYLNSLTTHENEQINGTVLSQTKSETSTQNNNFAVMTQNNLDR